MDMKQLAVCSWAPKGSLRDAISAMVKSKRLIFFFCFRLMYRNLHNVNLLIQIFLRTYIEMIYWSGTLELGISW